jgi:hypothetical protein
MTINWDASPVEVTCEIRGEENKEYQKTVINFTE